MCPPWAPFNCHTKLIKTLRWWKSTFLGSYHEPQLCPFFPPETCKTEEGLDPVHSHSFPPPSSGHQDDEGYACFGKGQGGFLFSPHTKDSTGNLHTLSAPLRLWSKITFPRPSSWQTCILWILFPLFQIFDSIIYSPFHPTSRCCFSIPPQSFTTRVFLFSMLRNLLTRQGVKTFFAIRVLCLFPRTTYHSPIGAVPQPFLEGFSPKWRHSPWSFLLQWVQLSAGRTVFPPPVPFVSRFRFSPKPGTLFATHTVQKRQDVSPLVFFLSLFLFWMFFRSFVVRGIYPSFVVMELLSG